MDSDDKQVGQILTRREVIALLGTAGVGLIGMKSSARPGSALDSIVMDPNATRMVALPSCVVRPAQTEGPYFVDEKLNRADVRKEPSSGAVSEGTPLDFGIRVSRISKGTCAPIAGAMVDIWQCDALGIYSDVKDTDGRFDTTGKAFLRGFQRSDPSGLARFTTIYPGFYNGRTVHIHFKVRVDGAGGRTHEFTSQVYFTDAQSDEIFKLQPYASNKQNRVINSRDGIFHEGGKDLILALEKKGSGYSGIFDIGLDMP